MLTTKIGIVQINNSFSNQNYLPYSGGLLQGFAQKYLSNKDTFEFLLPIYKRIPISLAVSALLDADIVIFSVYVWNFRISLEIAKQIKENKSEAIIVFGGPQVPNKETDVFLRSNPFIDIACHGEGEMVVLSILENFHQREWAKVPSISYINGNGKFIQTSLYGRISNLNTIPSPYLIGVFDSLMKANQKVEWLALWETNRGCPFSCTYCDWGAATKNKIYAYDTERLFNEIDWFSKNRIEFVFCCDANFGILERDIEIVEYLAENKRRYGYPKAFSIQSAKKFTERVYKMYGILSDAGLNKGVSLSLQSINEDTVRDTKRKNMPIETFKEVQQRLTSNNIETFTDLILGLPNETYKSFADGASIVIGSGQHNRIQFNNLSILPNAEMGDSEYQRKFGFDIIETKIINIHGSLDSTEEVYEIQKLVVGTNTMPKADWVKARVFGWMTALLHFDKLLQVPFVIVHKMYGVSFRNLIEIFTDNDKFPLLNSIYSFFVKKAIDIQNGGLEFCESKKWLNIWWPADELMLIELCTGNKLAEFYKEAEDIISCYLQSKKLLDYQSVLRESILLNQNLIKLPFQNGDIEMVLSYNIWDVYCASLRGIKIPLQKGKYCYKIERSTTVWLSWEDWCRKVVWYGNKKGAYIYDCKSLQSN